MVDHIHIRNAVASGISHIAGVVQIIVTVVREEYLHHACAARHRHRVQIKHLVPLLVSFCGQRDLRQFRPVRQLDLRERSRRLFAPAAIQRGKSRVYAFLRRRDIFQHNKGIAIRRPIFRLAPIPVDLCDLPDQGILICHLYTVRNAPGGIVRSNVLSKTDAGILPTHHVLIQQRITGSSYAGERTVDTVHPSGLRTTVKLRQETAFTCIDAA